MGKKHRRLCRLAIQAAAALLILGSCGSDEEEKAVAPNLPAVPFDYTTLALPAHFNQLVDHTPADNPVTNAGATLGRVLFYDKHLSKNNTTACGSCHHQQLAFTDGRAKAVGFEGKQTKRNAMMLVNLRFQRTGVDSPRGPADVDATFLDAYGIVRVNGFFSDMRAPTLEDLALRPIQDPVELGMKLSDLPGKLELLSYYPPLFAAAFGDSKITTARVARALAQFVRSIVSGHSKLDDGLAQNGNDIYEDFPNFTAQENAGKRVFIFTGRCEICHAPQYAASVFAANDGLDAEMTDLGLGAVRSSPDPRTGLNRLDGFFKASSLRNVELTAPYMHDGRFTTLEQVVDHYDSGVKPSRTLSPLLKDHIDSSGSPRQLHLTPDQKAALVAFFKTLTDRTLISDPRFSDPFPQ
jgi:cytochrome c peroxidase